MLWPEQGTRGQSRHIVMILVHVGEVGSRSSAAVGQSGGGFAIVIPSGAG